MIAYTKLAWFEMDYLKFWQVFDNPGIQIFQKNLVLFTHPTSWKKTFQCKTLVAFQGFETETNLTVKYENDDWSLFLKYVKHRNCRISVEKVVETSNKFMVLKMSQPRPLLSFIVGLFKQTASLQF